MRGGDARAGLLAFDPALGQRLPPLPDWLAAGFRLAGHLEFADRVAQLDQLQLALGEVEAGGELRLALGAPPTVDLRLDLARLRAPDGAGLPEGDGPGAARGAGDARSRARSTCRSASSPGAAA